MQDGDKENSDANVNNDDAELAPTSDMDLMC